jgi:hypothetical protein
MMLLMFLYQMKVIKQNTGTLVKGLVSKYKEKFWRIWLQLSENIFSFV